MSFLDVLDSIGTGQRPAVPQAERSSSNTSRPPYPLSNPSKAGTRHPQNGVKRKLDEAFNSTPDKIPHPSPNQGPERPSAGLQDRKMSAKDSAQVVLGKTPERIGSPASLATTPKGPPKGSYAALMAEAKAAQKQRAKSEVGLIKHQPSSKVRLSKTERRKREEGDKAIRAKLGKQPQQNSKVEKRARLTALKRTESSYKGTAKPASAVSAYRGTAGLPSQHRPSSADARHKAGQKSRKYDEYLGTDEEDEVDGSGVDDEEDGYGTGASSDMEADAFDVEEEELEALRAAREDDARELKQENERKLEKEKRKRALEALARKRR